MGRINTGGAKKRTGDNIALGSSVSGTTLKLTPPKGYYDGSTGFVTITDADFTEENIAEVNMFGKTGTLKKITTFVAGTLIAFANSLNVSGNSGTSYVKVKESQIKKSGTVTVSFGLKASTTTGPDVYARIYKNGVPVGTERFTTSTTEVTFTENISVVADDYIQIYAKGTGTVISQVLNMRISCGNDLGLATVIS